jgi:hypothetical protein
MPAAPRRVRPLFQTLFTFALLYAGLSFSASTSLSTGVSTNDPLNTHALFMGHPENVLLKTVTNPGTRLIAGGEHGVIIISEDAGVTWSRVSIPADTTINRIRLADPKFGRAVGRAIYGIDVELPGMVFARPKIPPTCNGSKAISIDERAAKACQRLPPGKLDRRSRAKNLVPIRINTQHISQQGLGGL